MACSSQPQCLFLPVVSGESLFFCPLTEADAGAKLCRCFITKHTIKLVELFVLSTRRPERREGLYFVVSFYAAHCSNHCLYFPIVTTEYGVDIKIL